MYANNISPVSSLIGTFAPFIVVVLIPAIICGILSKKLAARKGYTGYFWTGFFLTMMGLVYVAGLPNIKE